MAASGSGAVGGAGAIPIAEALVGPPIDTATQTLGQSSSVGKYTPARDIHNINLSTLSKGFDKDFYFGAKISGKSVEDRSNHDLSQFMQRIIGRIEMYSYDECYGGNICKYLLNENYDPELELGEVCIPQAGESFSSFQVSEHSIRDLDLRKKTIRRWIYNLLYDFSTGYWHDLIVNNADKSNGQSIIKHWKSMFMEDEIVNIVQRAEGLRLEKNFIKLAENPNPKMQRLLQGYNQLRGSAAGIVYDVSWFNSTLLLMIQNNPCYAIFRQTSGNLNKLLSCKSPQESIHMINQCWVDNHKEWKTMNFPKSTRSSVSNRNNKPGGRGNGANGNNTKTCANCKKKGHVKNDCMMKGGGRETKCYNCNNFGHIARDCRKPKSGGSNNSSPPCTYKDCRGRRETHSTTNCFSKRDDDKKRNTNQKRSRTSDNKLPIKKRSRTSTNDDHGESDNEQEIDDDVDVVPARSRASGARAAGVLLPPSNVRVVTHDD